MLRTGPRRPHRLVVVISGVCLALIVCEAGLRVGGIRMTGSFFTADRTLGWALRPNARGWDVDEGQSHVEINSDGQHDRERETGRRPGQYRVAVLGDSMVEG